jgi:hypothetical protein
MRVSVDYTASKKVGARSKVRNKRRMSHVKKRTVLVRGMPPTTLGDICAV